jgi:glycosyltransferase involved in cell wall biosynthesis
MADITVTVLMACYNAERWLSEAIESVLRQTFTDFEFIIVNDGSTDNTPNILQQYASIDTRIVIITKSKTGLADSLNVGILKARGEWIARLDADDICELTRLEKQVLLAKTSKSLVFIGTGCVLINENGKRLSLHRYPTKHSALVRHLRTVRKFPTHSSVMYRKELVQAIRGYRTRITRSQDFDLWLRLASHGKLACIDEPLVMIRLHADQISYEESGRRQKVDSRVALISFWISRWGCCDPVDSDDVAFETFREWTEHRLISSGFFELQDYKANLRERLQTTFSLPSRCRVLFHAMVAHPSFTVAFLKDYFFGESLTRRLAREWIREHKNLPHCSA